MYCASRDNGAPSRDCHRSSCRTSVECDFSWCPEKAIGRCPTRRHAGAALPGQAADPARTAPAAEQELRRPRRVFSKSTRDVRPSIAIHDAVHRPLTSVAAHSDRQGTGALPPPNGRKSAPAAPAARSRSAEPFSCEASASVLRRAASACVRRPAWRQNRSRSA